MRVHTDWLLTPERAAVHLPTGTAVVADLHLGYDRARTAIGEAVPGSTLDDTIAMLVVILRYPDVRRLVIAGDALENEAGIQLLDQLLGWLTNARLDWIGLVPGNHDRHLLERAAAGRHFSIFPDGVRLGKWQVIHGDRAPSTGPRVEGHLHPCVRWRSHVRAPCYLVGSSHIILPAFSPDTAGVNVLYDARWRRYRCGVIAGERVLDFGEIRFLSKRLKTIGL